MIGSGGGSSGKGSWDGASRVGRTRAPDGDLNTRMTCRARDHGEAGAADSIASRVGGDEIEQARRLIGKKKLRYSLDFAQYYHRWYNETILSLLAPGPSLTVLDCGCGTGILLPSLERCYGRVIGLDLFFDHLLEARAISRRARLLVGDIARLPLLPQSFDHVICRAALHRLPDVRLAFHGLFEILREGGGLVITEPIGDSSLVRLLKKAVQGHTAESGKSREWRYTTDDWIQMAQLAGFRIVSWFNLGYLALPLLGYPEETYLMRCVPFRMPVARLLMRIDRLIAGIPWINAHSWHAVFYFRRP